MMKPLLEVKNLKKHYITRTSLFSRNKKMARAVDGIDFTLHKGEIMGLVGESGSGKSTAALCALRLIEPTCGTIHFMGEDICSFSHKKMRSMRQQFQIIFQNPLTSLNPRKTVLDNLTGALCVHKIVHNEQERIERGQALLEKVGLDRSSLFLYPHQFSGGQQQRIAIGRALALQPKLLICDEVVSALDLSVQAEILNLLYQLKKECNLSYLFISHDLSVVNAFCDRILVMYRGKIVESAPREQLFAAPKHPYTKMLLASRLKKHPREKKELMILPLELEEVIGNGCPFYHRCPVRENSCKDHLPASKYDPTKNHLYNCIY